MGSVEKVLGFVGLVAVLLCALAVPVQPVAAGDDWCWDDPSLAVLGQTVAFSVMLPPNALADIQDVALDVEASSALVPHGIQPHTTPFHITYTVGVLHTEGGSTGFLLPSSNGGQLAQVRVKLVVTAKTTVPVRLQAHLADALGTVAGQILDLNTSSAQPIDTSFTLTAL